MTNLKIECEEDFDVSPVEAAFSERLAGNARLAAELVFTDASLHAIAKKTAERKSGARGLRSVVESLLIPIMYEIPSDATITRVTIDEDTVEGAAPHIEHGMMRPRYKSIAAQQQS